MRNQFDKIDKKNAVSPAFSNIEIQRAYKALQAFAKGSEQFSFGSDMHFSFKVEKEDFSLTMLIASTNKAYIARACLDEPSLSPCSPINEGVSFRIDSTQNFDSVDDLCQNIIEIMVLHHPDQETTIRKLAADSKRSSQGHSVHGHGMEAPYHHPSA